MEYENILGEPEKKVQKVWLWLLVVSTIMAIVSSFCSTVAGAEDFTGEDSAWIIGWFFGVAMYSLLRNSLTSGIVYYFAYKKMGTKVLVFLLFLLPFLTIKKTKKLFTIITNFKADDPVAMKCVLVFFWLASVVISIFWFIYSYRLWQVNKKIKHHKTSLQSKEPLQNGLIQ